MTHSKTIQVGVTGGIGSGKSVVCRIFQCLGVPVYEADARARWLTTHDATLKKEVMALLGPDAYREDGTYNRSYVASRVFQDESLLQQLNQIVHPRVFADTEAWVRQQQPFPYVIKEAALMNKAGAGNTLDYVLVVIAEPGLRMARIQTRDPSRTEAEIRAIMERQLPDEERLQLADFVIENNQHSPLIPQVLALHDFFTRLHREA